MNNTFYLLISNILCDIYAVVIKVQRGIPKIVDLNPATDCNTKGFLNCNALHFRGVKICN